MVRKLGSKPTKVKNESKPNIDSIDRNRGKEVKWASKPFDQLGEDLKIKSNRAHKSNPLV